MKICVFIGWIWSLILGLDWLSGQDMPFTNLQIVFRLNSGLKGP